MAKKVRGLGRGLDALLGDIELEPKGEKLKTLAVEVLQRGRYQPRKDIDPDRLQELADSISAQGLVQPIVVRPIEDNMYEIIAGERRWRAAQMAGLHEVPVIEKRVNDQAAMAIALIENIQREDLNSMDQAEALKRLAKEFEMSHQQIADAVGKSRVSITNLLRLNELHLDVKQLLGKGKIEMGHARALLGLELDQQSEAAHKVSAKNMTVRATEKLVQDIRANKVVPVIVVDPDIERLQTDLSGKLGAPVKIQHSKNGKGRLVIAYSSLEELEGVLEKIR